jgi:four helix bundle protein
MVERDGISLEKSKEFAIRIVDLCKQLRKDKNEPMMSKQILWAEANYAVSKKNLLAKKFIVLKECSENKYWLELLFDTQFIFELEFTSLKSDCKELLKILTPAVSTLKKI